MDSFSKPASFLYSVSFFLFFLHSLRHLHKILAYSWTKLQTKRTKPLIFIIQLSLSKFASEIHHLSALQTSSGSHTEPHSSMLFINQKCFNTYKNNKKDITHAHAHTLSGRRRSIHDESYRDRGHVISTVTTRLLHALLVGSCHSSGLRSLSVMLCSDWKRKQSALQTGCSLTQSLHHFRLCVSWFKACW